MQSLTAALWVECTDTSPGRNSPDQNSQEAGPDGSVAEGPAQEALIGAALLTVTAFRLRDATGLVEALRALTGALDTFLRARHSD